MRFLLCLLMVCAAAPALAGIPCIIVDVETTGTPTVALITPSGTGPSLADQGITVEIQIMECTFTPIVGFPREDIWISPYHDGEMWFCPGGAIADENTDADGRTSITGALAGGGYSTGGAIVYVSGNPMTSPYPGSLPLDFVSPDLDGDLDVDIADFSSFGQDFGSSAIRSDLDPNGIVDLGDFAVFGLHFGTNCP